MSRKIKILIQLDRTNWFLDTFIKYYLKFFNKNELFFLIETRFLSENNLVKYLKTKNFLDDEINIIPLHNTPLPIIERRDHVTNLINNLQKELLKDGSVLMNPDVDELIYHPNLRELLETFDSPYLLPSPIDVIHNREKEGDLNFETPIFGQRNFYLSHRSKTAGWYYKPIIIKDGIKWEVGRHTEDRNVTPGLHLIHIGKVDYNFVEFLNMENLNMYENQNVNQNGYIEEELKNWFDFHFKDLLPIPSEVLNSLRSLEI
jgi:hypothetical protein